MESNENGAAMYLVLANAENQYCIWPVIAKLPAGWQAVGPRGSKQECLSYIAEVWVDQRPRSLREAASARAH